MSIELIGYEEVSHFVPSEEMQKALQEKSEQLGKDIVVQWGDGQIISEPADKSKIYIFDYAASTGPVNIGTTDYINFRHYSEATKKYRRYTLYLVQRSLLRYDEPDNGNPRFPAHTAADYMPCGYFNHMVLWFKVPLMNFWRSASGNADALTAEQVFQHVVGQTLESCIEEDVIKRARAAKDKETMDMFLKEAVEATKGRITGIDAELGIIQQEIAAWQRSLVTHAVRLRDKEREREIVERMQNQDLGLIEKSIIECFEHARMERASYNASSRSLEMFTDQLYLYSPDKQTRTELGKFRLQLQVRDRQLLIYNLTNSKGGRHHPHVDSGGHPCWGDLEVQMREFLRDLEIVGIFSIAIQYLESYNPLDSYGRYAANWWSTQPTEYLQEDGTYALTKVNKVEKVNPANPSVIELEG